MRFDPVTIFPDFFAAADVSLLGKARRDGQLVVDVHDLRKWASGRHLSVDDTPAGGGAGMVMRPDVWGNALDEVLSLPLIPKGGRRVLAIPTPAGDPLTQGAVESLADAAQIVIACGRYEGLDARIPEHYRSEGVEVFEYSLGDYVLNGGEVAALALMEAVGRLEPDVIGNPRSLDEESHSAGLLEYPNYTQPRTWRGLPTPEVLLSGDHGRIQGWRRDASLKKTARLRPDLIERLDPQTLSSKDLTSLAEEGYLVRPNFNKVRIREAAPQDASGLSKLAYETFPDACPPQMSRNHIEKFMDQELSEERFSHYVSDPDANVVIAEVEETPICYTLTFKSPPPDLQSVSEGAAYISKCYTAAQYRGCGITGATLKETIEMAEKTWGSTSLVLATNIGNRRAAKFYRSYGFKKRGRRYFDVGGSENIDDVFVLELT